MTRRLAAAALALSLVMLRAPAHAGMMDEAEFKEIKQELGDSSPHIKYGNLGACYGGRDQLLDKLAALREQRSDLFEHYDFGPVVKRSGLFGHVGVIIHYKRQGAQTYDDAIKGGVVVDYTNYTSENKGVYKYRYWDDWRWSNRFGKGERDEDIQLYRDYYWDPDGTPKYPPPNLTYIGSSITVGPHPPEPPVHEIIDVQIVGSIDPNDKVGPAGVGPERFVVPDAPLVYTIFFENLATATAPAREVVITDELDPARVDLALLSLGPITFGSQTVSPPPGAQEFETTLDLRPERNVLLRIEAALASAPDRLVWRFESLDPATGQLPEDPFQGFLPPNVTPPEGEGSVTFTVFPLVGLPAGTTLGNSASIVFDTNPAIETPAWQNTLDRDVPASQVDAATVGPCSQSIAVEWSGADTGSGLRDFDVYRSVDGGPWDLWIERTTSTSETFVGDWGKSYGFYTVAHDQVENEEPPPAGADAEVVLVDCGAHDLAVTSIAAPKTITLSSRHPVVSKRVRVKLQNRGPVTEMIATGAALESLVGLELTSLGSCTPLPPILLATFKLPRALASKKQLTVPFSVSFDCANDPLKSTRRDPGHEDYSVEAGVDATALGAIDAHPSDDVCPRSVSPPGEIDPFPNGKLLDKGCGVRKPDRTFGAPVLVDVTIKPPRSR